MVCGDGSALQELRCGGGLRVTTHPRGSGLVIPALVLGTLDRTILEVSGVLLSTCAPPGPGLAWAVNPGFLGK